MEVEKFRAETKKRREKGDKFKQKPWNIIYITPGLSEGVLAMARDAALMGVNYKKHVFILLFLMEGVSVWLSLRKPNTEMIVWWHLTQPAATLGSLRPTLWSIKAIHGHFSQIISLPGTVLILSLHPSSQTVRARCVSEFRMYFRKVIWCTYHILRNTSSGL